MRSRIALFLTLCISGCQTCGNIATGNVAIGQVKKVGHGTPLLCPEYDYIDVSLGVLRSNGVGSFSKEDNEFVITNPEQKTLLEAAAESGQLVKITYDQRRLMFMCKGNIDRQIVAVVPQP